jgi:hypothetical protein
MGCDWSVAGAMSGLGNTCPDRFVRSSEKGRCARGLTVDGYKSSEIESKPIRTELPPTIEGATCSTVSASKTGCSSSCLPRFPDAIRLAPATRLHLLPPKKSILNNQIAGEVSERDCFEDENEALRV